MTEVGWTSNKDAAETYADKAAIEAVRHVLGAHKLTCDEHENLQQDFKDVTQEAYQQGRVAGLVRGAQLVRWHKSCAFEADPALALERAAKDIESVASQIIQPQQAQEGGVGDAEN